MGNAGWNATAISTQQTNSPQPRYVHRNSDKLAKLLKRAKRRA